MMPSVRDPIACPTLPATGSERGGPTPIPSPLNGTNSSRAGLAPRHSSAIAFRRVSTLRERHILERAVQVVAEQAASAGRVVDDAIYAGLDGSHPVTVHAKMLRFELLKVKADQERELATLSLDCLDRGLERPRFGLTSFRSGDIASESRSAGRSGPSSPSVRREAG
jgi:hypothetical protein